MINKKTGWGWLAIFVIALALELFAIINELPQVRYVSKPLLMPALGAWYFSQGKAGLIPEARWVPLALFFSWLGDLFLLFEDSQPLFFIAGLSSFLLAHIAYIIFFSRIRGNKRWSFRAGWIFPLACYYVLFMWVLGTALGPLTWPVRIYGLAICLMLFTAIRLAAGKPDGTGWKMLAGALLFVVSDSILALDRFHQPVRFAGCWIMLTYSLAQALIVIGAAQRLNLLTQQRL